jgi:ribosomal protein L29
MAKIEVMTTKTEQELVKLLTDTRATLRTERFAAAGARAKDSNSPKNLRAVVARVLTEQRARQFRSIEEVVSPKAA